MQVRVDGFSPWTSVKDVKGLIRDRLQASASRRASTRRAHLQAWLTPSPPLTRSWRASVR